MPGSSSLHWTPAPPGARGYARRLTCRHGEAVARSAPGTVPGTPGAAALRMLRAHEAAYGCDCARAWWDHYRPGAASEHDDAPATDAPEEPPGLASPWRYHHLVAGADTDWNEKELERLAA